MKPTRRVCSSCGSENVVHDAWASWNVEEQKWELENWFDDAFCRECDESCDIIDAPLEETPT